MTTLTAARRRVNTARTAPHRFGAGILATYPVHAVEYSAADAAWWAAESNGAEARRIDRAAADSLATDALTLGLIPRDLAETIARTRPAGIDR